MINSQRLRELLSYDAEMGILRWRCDRGSAKAGDIAGRSPHPVTGYLKIKIDHGHYLAHRLAWLHHYGEWPPVDIDHRDGNRTNNRIDNLREATKRQNQGNRRIGRNNKSGFKGVFWSKQHERWQAQIYKGGKVKYLGLFDAPEEASTAYMTAAAAHFGEFASPGSDR